MTLRYQLLRDDIHEYDVHYLAVWECDGVWYMRPGQLCYYAKMKSGSKDIVGRYAVVKVYPEIGHYDLVLTYAIAKELAIAYMTDAVERFVVDLRK